MFHGAFDWGIVPGMPGPWKYTEEELNDIFRRNRPDYRDFPKERSRKELEELGNVSNGREEVVKF
jgi:hypothetical protein